jgi:hypothetical protein
MRRIIPRWRKMTWVLNVWNALFLVWIIAGIASRPSKNCATDPDVLKGIISKQTCEAASDVGTGIGVTALIVLWFVGFIILSLVWLMSRPKHRLCPACGEDVKKGRTTCKKCGFNLANAASVVASKPTLQAAVSQPVQPPTALPPAGWYSDPERPGGKRWWDGSVWGVRDTEYPPS